MKNILFLLLFFYSFLSKGQVNISWPIDRAVFQRGLCNVPYQGCANNATVWFAGQTWQSNLKYTLTKLDKNGNNVLVYAPVSVTLNAGKIFQFSRLLTTGWYKVTFTALNNDGTIAGEYTLKFGVGEVFVIAGQSNAAGEGAPTYNSADNKGENYDCIISSMQPNKCAGRLPLYPVFGALSKSSGNITPNGFQPWAYNMLATKMINANTTDVIPVMFFNAGLSGSSSQDWALTAKDPNLSRSYNFSNERCTQNGGGNNSKGEPFRALRNSLNYYGSLFGVRGVIWHQGEADNIYNTSNLNYQANLDTVVKYSRKYFNKYLAWAISKVSWDGSTTDLQITTGQDNVRASASGIVDGININVNGAIRSDNYIGTVSPNNYRQTVDAVHFTAKGLDSLSTNYITNFSSTVGLLGRIPIKANPIVPISISQSGSSKVLTLNFTPIGKSSSNFECFFWTQGDDYTAVTYPNYGCSSTAPYNGTVLTVSTSGTWRCYMREKITGNVYVTQKIVVTPSSPLRTAVATLNSTVFPNPTYIGFENTIGFEIKEDANVRLEIVTEKGEVLQTLADGIHSVGKYQYPFTLKSKQLKEFNTLYYRLTIGEQSETKRIILE